MFTVNDALYDVTYDVTYVLSKVKMFSRNERNLSIWMDNDEDSEPIQFDVKYYNQFKQAMLDYLDGQHVDVTVGG